MRQETHSQNFSRELARSLVADQYVSERAASYYHPSRSYYSGALRMHNEAKDGPCDLESAYCGSHNAEDKGWPVYLLPGPVFSSQKVMKSITGFPADLPSQ